MAKYISSRLRQYVMSCIGTHQHMLAEWRKDLSRLTELRGKRNKTKLERINERALFVDLQERRDLINSNAEHLDEMEKEYLS